MHDTDSLELLAYACKWLASLASQLLSCLGHLIRQSLIDDLLPS